ncbi:endonuclease VII domain-containing protein [Streptomyces hygroscopicus]|uniref:endonuclease VII domain-containing protein n=1 Tax=Streptomyces hygroscopicus TaxID=1912 RepID=UPI00224048A6|nr:endonuclease VII domain-containing protein [Streptomyces hygroscopicus]
MKCCARCGEVKPRAVFATKPHSDRGRSTSASSGGLVARRQACRAIDNRVGRLKRPYGITEAEHDALIASRGGVCCISLSAPATHVDHCHETGRVRGVLCFNCNSGLGLLRDDPAAAHRAADYLEGNAWKPTLVAPGVYQLPS